MAGFQDFLQQGGGSGLGSLFGGIFGKNRNPYKDAMKEYERYGNKSAEYQNPFYNAGKGALPDYQNYLKNMSNPSDFLNNLMKNYQQSDYSKNLQDESMRGGINAGSASGLTGSSALTKFMQENSGKIASEDMQSWLQNALGINKQYGSGLEDLMRGGRESGNKLSDIFGNLGDRMAGSKAGSRDFDNQRWNDIFSGVGSLAELLAFL